MKVERHVNTRFLRGDARGAEDGDAGAVIGVVGDVGLADGDLEARRRRLHRDRGGRCHRTNSTI